jgi:hypothetical protein
MQPPQPLQDLRAGPSPLKYSPDIPFPPGRRRCKEHTDIGQVERL